MMRDPRISIVIPHLNQPEHLRRCLESLEDQSCGAEDVEVIVVDNGSKTLPTEICRAFANVRIEQEATPGPGPARNRGVAASRAPLLAFIDADCIADRNWLVAIADAFEDKGTTIIGGDVRIAVADAGRLTTLEAYESVFAYRQKEYITKQGFSGTGNLATRRTVYEAVGPFAGIDVAEDRDWGRRAGKHGFKVAYVPSMIVYHPARSSFDEIFTKWDRHIRHDFADRRHRPLGRLRWILRAIAVGLSPAREIPRIVLSDRVQSVEDRCRALFAVIRIRLFRCASMLRLVMSSESGSDPSWNRS